MNHEVFAALGEALSRGEEAALVTIVSSNGSTPQRVGAKMLVFGDGRIVGTVGGGCYEHDAIGKAKQVLQTRKPTTVKYDLNDDFAEETGPGVRRADGSVHRAHRSVARGLHLRRRPRRLLPGEDGARGRLRRARDRRSRGVRQHRALSVRRIGGRRRHPGLAGADQIPSTAYAVIVTRGHRNDLDALRALAPRDLRYIGLIGSRAKVARLYEQLLAETSVDPALLERIHAPIGLDLGAVTPQEIAVSITAELIAVRRGKAEALKSASLRWFPNLKALR